MKPITHTIYYVLILTILAACQPKITASTPAPQPTGAPVAAATSAAVIMALPTPTAPPLADNPAVSHHELETSGLDIIDSQNIQNLSIYRRLDKGLIYYYSSSQSGLTYALATSLGVYIYAAGSPEPSQLIQVDPRGADLVALSSDASLLALHPVGCDCVAVYDVSNGINIHDINHVPAVNSLVFSPHPPPPGRSPVHLTNHSTGCSRNPSTACTAFSFAN